MKSKTAQRILDETPQETKDKIKETANIIMSIKNKAIEYYKEHIEGVPLTQDEVIDAYLQGFNSAKKIVTDLLNKYKSNLQEETHIKLTKVINQDKVNILKAKIEVLEELKNKL